MMMVGKKNINFVRGFLMTEHITVVGERVGGNNGLIIHYHANTFEVFVKLVSSRNFRNTEKEEIEYRERITRAIREPREDNVTLF